MPFRKNLFLAFSLSSSVLWAQPTVLFHENFDQPSGADSVSQGVLTGINPNPWQTTTQLSVSPGQSYWLQGSTVPSEVYFETNSFSTVGSKFITLEFDQIAKIFGVNSCRLEYSINNGASWAPLFSNSYLGADSHFLNNDQFNENSYNAASNQNTWLSNDPLAVPDSNWWRHETFDLTHLVNDTNQAPGNMGYSNVKIRFIAEFLSPINQSSGQYAAGWFIDNIKILGNNCALLSPELNFDFNPMPCYNPRPTGILKLPGSGSKRIGIEAKKRGPGNSGIQSVRLIYRFNGGPWDTAAMTSVSGTDEYSHILYNLQVQDTIDYFIEALNLCNPPQINRKPVGKGNFHQFITVNLPSPCSPGVCFNSDMIFNFPWSEDFEGSSWVPGTGNGNSGNLHRGDAPDQPEGTWQFGPPLNISHGFSVRQGSTGTNNTGPLSSNTPGGNKYLYTEFSPVATTTGSLNSSVVTPCIDLRNQGPQMLSFYYHMYGRDINRLQVDVDTGQSNPSFQTAYYVINGPQQSSSSDSWQRAFVNLIPFQGKIIRLRFTVFRVPGGDKADAAIDDLRIEALSGRNVQVKRGMNNLESQCSPAMASPVLMELSNLGQDTLYEVPAAYRLNNTSAVRDTLRDTLYPGESADFSFSIPLSFNPNNSHQLTIWSELPGDDLRSDDTLYLNLPPRLPAINQMPYYFDFEDTQPATSNPGNLNSPYWIRPGNQVNANWHIHDQLMNDRTPEPTYGLGTNNHYLLLRTSGSGVQYASFQSSCINLGNLTQPQLSIQASVYETGIFKVEIKGPNSTWLKLMDIDPYNVRHMTTYKADLSNYQGQNIQLRFTASDSGTSLDKAIAFDNILIKDAQTPDFALTGINRGAKRLPAHQANLLPFNLNIGINHNPPTKQDFNGQVGVIFIDECDPSQVFQATVNVSPSDLNIFPPFGTCMVNLSLSSGIPAGRYHTKVFLDLPTDSLSFNDTLAYTSVFHSQQNLPYQNDFDSCYGDFAAVGNMLQWERGPATPGSPSGNDAWVTNLDAHLLDSQIAILRAPIFTGLNSLKNVRLSFWHRYNFNQSPTNFNGKVEYFNPGINDWEVLQSADPADVWYNGQNSNDTGAFTGNSNGWQQVSVNTGHLPIGTNLILRFVAQGSVPGQYWEIDDLDLTIPPQYSVAPVQFLTDGNMPLQGTSIIPEVKIANSGLHSVDSLQIELFDQNGISLHQQQLNMSLPLLPGENQTVVLNTTLPLNATLKNLIIVTSQPNGRQDDIPRDDTLIQRIFYLADTIDQWPYCQDFDTSSTFVGFNTNGQYDSQWKYGFPGNAVINGPYSGLNAWYTSDSTYAPMSDNYLYTPRFSLPGNECYRLSFQHWVDTELHLDGGQVEFTTNGGLTWGQLGGYNDSGWYNVPFIQAFGGLKPGFSGHSGGWQPAFIDFHLPAEAELQLRFHFASNASVEYDGWAIDDFCLEALGYSACSTIGEKEFNSSSAPILNLYPNPTQDELNLIFLSEVQKATSCQLEIYSSSGQRLREWQPEMTPGKELSISVGDLPKGVYHLRLMVNHRVINKRFHKN